MLELKENTGVEEKLQSTSVNQAAFTMVVNVIINFVHRCKFKADSNGSGELPVETESLDGCRDTTQQSNT